MSPCHILVILTIFQIFPLLLYLLWESVISVWCYYYDLLKSQKMVSIFSNIFKLRHIHCLLDIMHTNREKAMARHSSTLAWKIPWVEEPGGLQSTGSLRVRHDWATSLSLFRFMHWRRKWQPTPVFLPGESQGRGSLVGCRLWGHTESDTTEAT